MLPFYAVFDDCTAIFTEKQAKLPLFFILESVMNPTQAVKLWSRCFL